MAARHESNLELDLSTESLALSSWGLPEAILTQYESCGVRSMFPWQAECLLSGNVLDGENLIFSAPTSAGKSLIAEILMLKRVLERRKKALLIVPFISMAKEKVDHLQDLYRNVDLRVGGFMGNSTAPGGFKSTDVLICTIEKANNMVNRLMEADRLDEIGIIVVDEIHLLGDPSRGYLLELLLTKIMFASRRNSASAASWGDVSKVNDADADDAAEKSHCAASEHAARRRVQVVGMSATLPNLDVVAEWLGARLYRTDFRPVPLTQMMKVGPVIHDSELKVIRTLSDSVGICEDADQAVQLTLETVTTGHSVLIFCPSRDWCENLAQKIAKDVMAIGSARESMLTGLDFLRAAREGLRSHLNGERLESLIDELRDSAAGLDSILKRTICSGVAFHHAGLTVEERDVVESGFRRGVLKVLVATSTLSSGVNLPARRVLIRSPYAGGNRLLDSLVYHQMIGRAGRTGVDTVGESILMCKESERRAGVELMTDGLRPIDSCLKRNGERLSSALRRAILEIVVNGVARSAADVKIYVNCTLLAALAKCNQESGVERCLQDLLQAEFIRLEKDPEKGFSKYVPTALGKAVVSAALPPDEGIALYNELDRARKGLLLENDLHLLYQVTPLSAVSQIQRMDWFQYRTIWHGLPDGMRRVGEAVGVDDGFLFRCLRGFSRNNENELLMIHSRFYSALALNELANEVPLKDVADKYGFNRGYLQSLQQSAATYSGMVAVFCEKLGWRNLELLISQFQARLHFGVSRELCDLMLVSSLDSRIARAVYDSGVETCADLAATHPATVEKFLVTTGPFSKGKTVWRQGLGDISVSRAAALIVQEAKAVVLRRLGRRVDVRWADSQSAVDDDVVAAAAAAGAAEDPHPLSGVISQSVGVNASSSSAGLLPSAAASIKISENVGFKERAARPTPPVEDPASQELFDDSRPSSPSLFVGDAGNGQVVESSPVRDSAQKPAAGEQTAAGDLRSSPNDEVQPAAGTSVDEDPDVTWPSLTAVRLMEAEEKSGERDSLKIEASLGVSSESESTPSEFRPQVEKNLSVVNGRKSFEDGHRRSVDVDERGGSVLESMMNEKLDAAYLDETSKTALTSNVKLDSFDCTLSESMVQFLMEAERDPRAEQDYRAAAGAVQDGRAQESEACSESMLQFLIQAEFESEVVGLGNPALSSPAAPKSDGAEFENGPRGRASKDSSSGLELKLEGARNLSNTPKTLTSTVDERKHSERAFVDVVSGSLSEKRNVDLLPGLKKASVAQTPAAPAKVEETGEASECPPTVSENVVLSSENSFSDSIMQFVMEVDPLPKSAGPEVEKPTESASNDFGGESGSGVPRLSSDGDDLFAGSISDSFMVEVCRVEKDYRGRISEREEDVGAAKTFSDSPSVSDSVLEQMMAVDLTGLVGSKDAKEATPVPYSSRLRSSRGSSDRRNNGDDLRRAAAVSGAEVKGSNSSALIRSAAKTTPPYSLRRLSGRGDKGFSDGIPGKISGGNSDRQRGLQKSMEAMKNEGLSSTGTRLSSTSSNSCTPVLHRVVAGTRLSSSSGHSPNEVIGPSPEVVVNSNEKRGKNRSKLHHRRKKDQQHGTRKRRRHLGASVADGGESPSPFSVASKMSRADSTADGSAMVCDPENSVFPVPIDLSVNEDETKLMAFVHDWKRCPLFSLSLACVDVEAETKSIVASRRIGSRFQPQTPAAGIQDGRDVGDPERFVAVVSGANRRRKLVGIAVSLDGAAATYISVVVGSVPRRLSVDRKLREVRAVLLHHSRRSGTGSGTTAVVFEARCQLRVLWKTVFSGSDEFPGFVADGCRVVDPKVAAWYIDAGVGEPRFQDLVTGALGNCEEILASLTGHDPLGSVGLTTKSQNAEEAMKNACVEAVLSHKLWRSLETKLRDVDCNERFYSVESSCVVAVARMESHGFGFDVRRCLELRKALEVKRESLVKLAHKAAGRPFNLSSRRKLTEVLTDVLGKVKVAAGADKPCLTITSNSLDKDVLQAAAKFHPLPEYILKWRKIGMALTQFVVPFSGGDLIGRGWNQRNNGGPSSLSESGSRVHADWDFFTATGRLATRDPNLQTVFKDFEAAGEVFSLRSMFVAQGGRGGGGAFLIAGDYSQMDLRILAHLAEDPALLAHLNADHDVLRVVAAALLRKDPSQVTDEERQSTKQVVYGIVYGVGPASLARQLDSTEREAEALTSSLLDGYPGVRRYVRAQVERVRASGFVSTLSGRRRQLPAVVDSASSSDRAHAERQAVHTAVQGSAADLLKAATVATERELRREFGRVDEDPLHPTGSLSSSKVPRLVMSLHDELIYEAPGGVSVDAVARCVKRAMESAWVLCTGSELRVRTPVKISVGSSWGSLAPWNPAGS